jgi:hypothetical protein
MKFPKFNMVACPTVGHVEREWIANSSGPLVLTWSEVFGPLDGDPAKRLKEYIFLKIASLP